MWIVWFLGIMDIAATITMFMVHYDLVGAKLGIAFTIYLIGKGYYFFGDIASFIDLIGGLHFLLMLMGLKSPLVWLFSIYFFQKALVSLRDM